MRIRLAKNGGIRIDGDGRGILIRCEEGMLWLTQTGDPQDHFLAPHQEFLICRKGRVIVEAHRDACMVVAGAV